MVIVSEKTEIKTGLYNTLLVAFIVLCITIAICSYLSNKRKTEIEMIQKGMYKAISDTGHEIWLPKEALTKNKEQM